MKEQLITFKTAKLSKEKGFDISSRDRYGLKSTIVYSNYGFHINDEEDYIFTSAPTQSLLQKWLRENHNIHVLVLKPMGYLCSINGIITKEMSLASYEEALEKGLQEALKLIEL